MFTAWHTMGGWGGGGRGWAFSAGGLAGAVTRDGAKTPPNPAATLTSRAELVSVPVIVIDKFGSHVHALKKEDFTVYEEGVEQPVSVFEEVQQTSTVQAPITLPSEQFSNVRSDDAGNRQFTIVLID